MPPAKTAQLSEFLSKYKYKNEFLSKLLLDFTLHHRTNNRIRFEMLKDLVSSFGDDFEKIKSEADFTDKLFFKQADMLYYGFQSKCYSNMNPMEFIIVFYRFVIETFDEYPFFKNSNYLTRDIFFYKGLIYAMVNNFYIIRYNSHDRVLNQDKIYFILEDYERLSTNNTKEDYFPVDVSRFTNDIYKKMVVNWLYDTNAIPRKSADVNSLLVPALNMLSEIKKQKDYPNKSLTHFSNQEAILLKEYIFKIKKSDYTANKHINYLKKFIRWGIDSEQFTVEAMFFDYLTIKTYTFVSKPEAIPEDVLAKMNKKLLEDSKKSLDGLIVYTVFHLLLQTEFRVNQILHLTTDCIKPSVKTGQYIVESISKTSYGQINSYTITGLTYKMLMEIIEQTNELRDTASMHSLKDYIFVHKCKNGIVGLYTHESFYKKMKDTCKALNLPKTYSAANLRDTHMTRAYEHIIKEGKTDLELALLTKHKNIDTTKSHYIDVELEKMLESTYGITIGEDPLNTDNKILEAIPDEFNNDEHDVENGCGKCSAENCLAINALPCMACKYFITTPEHAKFFEKAIDMLDKNLLLAKTKHDKDDILKIKEFYVLYLRAIYRYKESEENADKN